MYFKLVYILSGFLFLWSSFCSAQRIKECGPSSQCKLLSQCPQMEKFSKSGNPADLEVVSNNICEFIGSTTKVCCSRDFTHTSENLLPSKCGRPIADDKITNGPEAPLGAYPWIAALGYIKPGDSKPTFSCAGAIINSKYVLTVAHCVDVKQLGIRKLSVIHLGDHNLDTERDCKETRVGVICSSPPIVAGVEEIISHPMYNTRGSNSDDIALIRLNITLDLETATARVEPVCLPPNGFNFKTFEGNKDPIATGWGFPHDQNQNGTKTLLRAKVKVADDHLCKEKYRKNFVTNQLCIGGSGNLDSCHLGGSPLVMTIQHGPPFFLFGLSSFGSFPCGIKGFPDVYTNVADYRDWIISNMTP